MEQLNRLLPYYLCNLALWAQLYTRSRPWSSLLLASQLINNRSHAHHLYPLPSTLSLIHSNLTIVTRQNFTHYDMSTGRSPCPSLLFSASGWSCVVCRNLDHGYFHQCTQAILHSSQLPIMYSMLWCATIPLLPLALFLAFMNRIILQDYIYSVVASTN